MNKEQIANSRQQKTRRLTRICRICCLLSAICYLPHAQAADEDPFAFDDFQTADYDFQSATDARISDAAPLNMTIDTPVYLNENTSFAAVEDMDIAGSMLGMAFSDIQSLFFKSRSLYAPRAKNSVIYSVPGVWKNNLDYECRQQKVIIPGELEKCINTLAKKRGLLYASELHLVRMSTGETIDVFFTSNATGNRVWKIVYKNDANEIEGDAEKFADQRDKKILSFWQGVLDKYGAPNSGNDKWISSDNSFDPTMTAFYGQLELTDLGRNAMDAAENAAAAQENFRAKPYAF
ncbi:MAG: hypothetical protein LBK26_00330 [Rickettsiales bacterium]|jgi:hypothetical protein|nr:hypothetical protein [Rickettsiales bacterium]